MWTAHLTGGVLFTNSTCLTRAPRWTRFSGSRLPGPCLHRLLHGWPLVTQTLGAASPAGPVTPSRGRGVHSGYWTVYLLVTAVRASVGAAEPGCLLQGLAGRYSLLARCHTVTPTALDTLMHLLPSVTAQNGKKEGCGFCFVFLRYWDLLRFSMKKSCMRTFAIRVFFFFLEFGLLRCRSIIHSRVVNRVTRHLQHGRTKNVSLLRTSVTR